MIELYGVVRSRAFRSLWALEEVGVPYRLVPVDFTVGAKQAKYLALNNRHRVHLPEAERDPVLIAAAEAALRAPLKILGDALADRAFLLGTEFSFADLNVAAVLATSFTARYDLSPFETVNRWFGTCLSRPAVQRALAR